MIRKLLASDEFWNALGVLFLVALVLVAALTMSACAGVPVQFCLEHPTYGKLCVETVDGKLTFAVSLATGKRLDPADESKVAEWYSGGGGR